jgi:hypothetical protein
MRHYQAQRPSLVIRVSSLALSSPTLSTAIDGSDEGLMPSGYDVMRNDAMSKHFDA